MKRAFLLFLGAIAASACATGNDTDTDPAGTTGAGGGGVSSSSSGGSGPCTSAAECAALTDECNTGTCINGTCEKVEANEGTTCDDGLTCTLTEVCQAGVCTAT